MDFFRMVHYRGQDGFHGMRRQMRQAIQVLCKRFRPIFTVLIYSIRGGLNKPDYIRYRYRTRRFPVNAL